VINRLRDAADAFEHDLLATNQQALGSVEKKH